MVKITRSKTSYMYLNILFDEINSKTEVFLKMFVTAMDIKSPQEFSPMILYMLGFILQTYF